MAEKVGENVGSYVGEKVGEKLGESGWSKRSVKTTDILLLRYVGETVGSERRGKGWLRTVGANDGNSVAFICW